MSANNKTDITHSLKDEHKPKKGDHDSTAEYLESLVEDSKNNHESHVGVDQLGSKTPSNGQKADSNAPTHKSSLLDRLKGKLLPDEKSMEARCVAMWKSKSRSP
jgi:hypothetical protein